MDIFKNLPCTMPNLEVNVRYEELGPLNCTSYNNFQ